MPPKEERARLVNMAAKKVQALAFGFSQCCTTYIWRLTFPLIVGNPFSVEREEARNKFTPRE